MIEERYKFRRVPGPSFVLLLFLGAINIAGVHSALPTPHPKTLEQANRQCDSLRVDYQRIDASQFPVIISDISVYDSQDSSIGGLTEDDFAVYENGVLQSPILVEAFGSDTGGVTIALVLDRSNSMSAALPAVKRTAIEFINLMLKDDQMAIATFGKDARLDHDFSKDKQSLADAVNAITLEPYTALYDGVMFGLDLLKNVPGHKAMVLLTDGRDRDSKADLDEVLAAVAGQEIPVFGIGLGLKPDWGEPELQQIAETSGGRYYRSPTTQQLAEIYRTIFFILHRYWYRITYTSSHCEQDGTLRQVQIEARALGETCDAANQYTAPRMQIDWELATSDAAIPGEVLAVILQTTADSEPLQNIVSLTATLRFDPAFLAIQEPAARHILAGPLFGTGDTHTLSYQLDPAAGMLTITLQRNSNQPPVNGRGAALQLGFVVAGETPDSTALTLEIESIEIHDLTNCRVPVTAEGLTLYSDGLLVWPGDTDANGVVELADVLVLGPHWALTGPTRPGPEDQLAWMPHLARRFVPVAATHADADGNGQINERDIVPIGLNWAKTKADYVPPLKGLKTGQSAPDGLLHAELASGKERVHNLLLRYEPLSESQLAGVTMRVRAPESIPIDAIAVRPTLSEQPLLFVHKVPRDNMIAVGMMRLPSPGNQAIAGELMNFEITTSLVPRLEDFTFEQVMLVGTTGAMRKIAVQRSSATEKTPSQFVIFPPYPNPFNPQTRLRFSLPAPAQLHLHVYDLRGRLLADFGEINRPAGIHTFQWDGRDASGRELSSGVYFIEMIAETADGGRYRAGQKVTLMR